MTTQPRAGLASSVDQWKVGRMIDLVGCHSSSHLVGQWGLLVQGLLQRVPVKHRARAKLEPCLGYTLRGHRNRQVELVCWTMTERLSPVSIGDTNMGIPTPIVSMQKNPLDLRGSCGGLEFFPSQARYTPDILIIHTTWWKKLLSSLPEHARGVPEQHTAPVGLDQDGQEGSGIFKRQDIASTFLAPISDNSKSSLGNVNSAGYLFPLSALSGSVNRSFRSYDQGQETGERSADQGHDPTPTTAGRGKGRTSRYGKGPRCASEPQV